MAKEEKKTSKFDKKGLFSGLFAAILLVVVIVVIVLTNQPETIPEGFFETDDEKVVVSLSSDIANFEESEYEPEITHIVYFRDGDKITSEKLYYEYNSEDEAKTALNNIDLNTELFSSIKRSDKYLILTVKSTSEDYGTVSDLLEAIEKVRAAGAILEDASNDDDSEEASETTDENSAETDSDDENSAETDSAEDSEESLESEPSE